MASENIADLLQITSSTDCVKVLATEAITALLHILHYKERQWVGAITYMINTACSIGWPLFDIPESIEGYAKKDLRNNNGERKEGWGWRRSDGAEKDKTEKQSYCKHIYERESVQIAFIFGIDRCWNHN